MRLVGEEIISFKNEHRRWPFAAHSFHKVAEMGDVILSLSLALSYISDWGGGFNSEMSILLLKCISNLPFIVLAVSQQPRKCKRKVPGTSSTVLTSSNLAQGFLSHSL